MFDKIKEDIRESLTGSTPENDLRARLHADHSEVAKLIDELLASEDYELALREDIREQIVVGLTSHSKAEEEIVYSRLQQYPATQRLTQEAIVEHDGIDRVLQTLKEMDVGDPGLSQVVEDLKAKVQHHVVEEENKLIPQAEKEFGQTELARMIPQFNARKAELMVDLELESALADDLGTRGAGRIDRDNPLAESDSRF
jgi:hemerythrin superfamily protein